MIIYKYITSIDTNKVLSQFNIILEIFIIFNGIYVEI